MLYTSGIGAEYWQLEMNDDVKYRTIFLVRTTLFGKTTMLSVQKNDEPVLKRWWMLSRHL